MAIRRRTTKHDGPDPIDVHVGERLRLRRTLLGLSQQRLGEALDLTFQQVQKYERGTNRISAGRLLELSRILDVPVGFFFQGAPGFVAAAEPTAGLAEDADEFAGEIMRNDETVELVKAYYAIQSPQVRRKIYELAKVLAEE